MAATSHAMAPWPPPSPTTATRGPASGRARRSAWARSIISPGVDTRYAPADRHAASTTETSLTSAPVCDTAARMLASLRPTVSRMTGVDAAAAASTNARPSLKSSA